MMMEDEEKLINNKNTNSSVELENEEVERGEVARENDHCDDDDNDGRDKFEDGNEEDREALDRLSSAPNTNKKVYSYSQQLGPPPSQRRHRQGRKHSLDDIPRPPTTTTVAAIILPDHHRDISDVDFFSLYSNSSTNSSLRYTTASSAHFSSGPPSVVLDYEDEYYTAVHSRLPSDDLRQSPLPEFLASCGATPIFKSPIRAAVHHGRPPCLELRPHPLRETQVGKFLRNIACTNSQLWAGQENGVRFWNLAKIYDPGSGLGGRIRRGDENAAPFHESVSTSPTFCLVIDIATGLVCTGHKDGKIRSWRIYDDDLDGPLKEGLCWQAHKGPVLSLVISSYGDMWSGGEGGVIKIWAWETIEKSLALSSAEKHLAALLVERSHIDLRTQVTVNGACSISSAEIKCLLSDNVRAKVWCAQPMSLSLWDARTKELVKVFNIEGQIENQVDLPGQQQQDQLADDEMKVKFVSNSKKEKHQGFLQRSRNAIIGAAGAVRRAATRGAGAFVVEDNKRIEALALAADGMIWSGCNNGLLVQWDGNGNRLQELTHHSSGVTCFCTSGTQIYVGYVNGIIQKLDLNGNLCAVWVAHSSPVLKMAVGSGSIYSLGAHGGIRGWPITSPGPLDSIIRSELAGREVAYTRRDDFRILVGTWNVGQGRASHDALMTWLGSVASDVGIVVVGLQEVEMGAGFLAVSAAKETVGLEGSAVGQWWQDAIGKALEEGVTFERMGSRQLAGLLISLWVRNDLRTHVGDVDAGAVPCGFGRAIGNKGGVGLRIRVLDRIICFVNCHLAAHLEAVKRRNADFNHIYKNMVFSQSSNITAAASVATASQTPKGTNASSINSENAKPDLSEADMVVFLGDFNYRLFGISYDEARDFVSQRSFDWLREKDQLRKEMKDGKVFQGMREALIRFPPTYKFERNKPGLGGYDSGEKKRIPAWCDRVIYRDTRSASTTQCSLACPLVASVMQYEACMDVIESDHKPVRCKFHVQVSHVDRSVRRQEFGDIIRNSENVKSLVDELRYIPETMVNTNSIMLQNQDTSILRITNKSLKEAAIFKIICEGQSTVKDEEEEPDYHSRGSFGFPRWLEVTPAAGVIKPDYFADIAVHHEEFHTLEDFVDGIPQNWWCEDTRDKEVLLVVIVQGCSSTETSCHQVKVRHCMSCRTVRLDPKSNGSRRSQGGSAHRSQLRQVSSGSSVGSIRKS